MPRTGKVFVEIFHFWLIDGFIFFDKIHFEWPIIYFEELQATIMRLHLLQELLTLFNFIYGNNVISWLLIKWGVLCS